MSRGQLKLFSGSAHPALAAEIGEFLGVPLGHARLQRFPDTEVSFQTCSPRAPTSIAT
jgi:ribose-phosphate pyrophosphokinase